MSRELKPIESSGMGRRQLMLGISLIGLQAPTMAFGTPSSIRTSVSSKNLLDYGARPDGSADCTAAFNAAFNDIPPNGGSIYIPDGDYRVDSPLVFGGKGLTIYGNGEQATRVFITHSGTAISFVHASPLFMSCVRDLGLAAVGPAAACAISISYPPISVYGAQTALIENVSIPSPIYGADSNFTGGVNLRGCWQSLIRNVKHLSPGPSGPIPGSYFISLGGRCIDVRIVDSTGQNSDLGITLVGYTEGIHVQNCALVSSNFGISMPVFSFDQFEGSQTFSTLGLTLSDSEVAVHKSALQLSRVLSAYVSNSHLGLQSTTPSASVVTIVDSQDVKISGCTISGQRNGQVGISIGQSAYGSMFNCASDCYFVGLAAAVFFGHSVTSNIASGMRVNNSNQQLRSDNPVIDWSGNLTNSAQWVTAQGRMGSNR